MDKAEKRLARLQGAARRRASPLGLEFGFRLWDGSRVPADWPADALTIAIADEGVVAGLVRAPRLTTLANLWAAKRLDIVNGAMFDLVARRPKARTRELRDNLDKLAALRAALSFLFTPRGGPVAAARGSARIARATAARPRTRGTSPTTTTSPTPSIELWLDKEMVYTCGYFHDWSDDLDTAQAQEARHGLPQAAAQARRDDARHRQRLGRARLPRRAHYGVKSSASRCREQQIAYARDEGRAARPCGPGDVRAEGLCAGSKATSASTRSRRSACSSAIGVAHFPTYFGTVQRVLKPGGLYLHHAITRPGKRRGARTRQEAAGIRGADALHLPRRRTRLSRAHRSPTSKLHGFEVHDVEGWREHYQRTCRIWHDRLCARYDEACGEVGERQTRVWLAYLAACSIVFERNACESTRRSSASARGRQRPAADARGSIVGLVFLTNVPIVIASDSAAIGSAVAGIPEHRRFARVT